MRLLYAVVVGLSAAFLVGNALAQSQANAPAWTGIQVAQAPSSSGGLGLGDKVINATSPTQVVEKLSNIVSDEYTIGAEDVLEITVWRNQDLSKTVQVRPDGRFSMPVIRDVVAVGKTPSQLADEITRKLKEYVQNPVVAISVKEVNSYSIFVLGEVVKPGKYPPKQES